MKIARIEGKKVEQLEKFRVTLRAFQRETLRINASRFAESIGVPIASYNNIVNEKSKTNPSLEFIISIKAAYPELDLNHLLAGEGPVWLNDAKASEDSIKSARKEMLACENQVRALQQEKALLEARLEQANEQVDRSLKIAEYVIKQVEQAG